MRPVGAIVLGAYIDRIGRRQGLIVTLAIMALGTVVIAFCPTYATIGIAAPIIVLIGRLLQGFSAGVELGGVSVYLSEIATPGNRGFYTSFQSSSQQVAIFVAAIIGFILSEVMPADTVDRLGLAHSLLHRLHDHPVHLRAAALAGGNAGIPRHEEASDRVRGVRLGGRQLAHRHPRHDDRGPDHDDLLLHHRLHADLRQDVLKLSSAGRPARDAARRRHEFHLESGRRRDVRPHRPQAGAADDREPCRCVTAYPALHWLVAAPTFGKLLAVEMMFSFYFGVYSGTMLGCAGRDRAGACPHHLLLARLRARRGAVRHLHAVRLDLADRADRRQGLARLLADVRRRRSASSRRSIVYRGGTDHRDARGRRRVRSRASAGRALARPGFDFPCKQR